MTKTSYLLLCSALVLGACSPNSEKMLQGQWQGVAVLENGDSLAIDPALIRMSFDEQNGYAFASTLNYREAGTFYADARYLYTTDTLNQATTEKAVEIVKLTADSLFLKMNEAGRERLLKLVKLP
jgi:hypothetical protein